MTPRKRILAALNGWPAGDELTHDERLVYDMAVYLEAMDICKQNKAVRRYRIEDLPKEMHEQIKQEILQFFSLNRSSPQQSDER